VPRRDRKVAEGRVTDPDAIPIALRRVDPRIGEPLAREFMAAIATHRATAGGVDMLDVLNALALAANTVIARTGRDRADYGGWFNSAFARHVREGHTLPMSPTESR
jgi:hypothetical protein